MRQLWLVKGWVNAAHVDKVVSREQQQQQQCPPRTQVALSPVHGVRASDWRLRCCRLWPGDKRLSVAHVAIPRVDLGEQARVRIASVNINLCYLHTTLVVREERVAPVANIWNRDYDVHKRKRTCIGVMSNVVGESSSCANPLGYPWYLTTRRGNSADGYDGCEHTRSVVVAKGEDSWQC
jgi:hypothetical protein